MKAVYEWEAMLKDICIKKFQDRLDSKDKAIEEPQHERDLIFAAIDSRQMGG